MPFATTGPSSSGPGAGTVAAPVTGAGGPINFDDINSIGQAAQQGGDGTVTQAVWAYIMLQALGGLTGTVPLTLNNVQNVERWMTAEEPDGDWFHNNNPLNINASGSGSDSFPNLSASATATAKLLTSSNYAGIVSALASNAPPAVFSAAVVQSPWAGGRYGVAAAGAPAKYVVSGRGLDYIATLGLPAQVSAGTAAVVAPGDAGGTNAESDFLPGNPNATTVAGLIPGLSSLLGDIESAAFWKRIGIGLGGFVLIVGGLVIFISTTKPGQEAVSVGKVAALA